MTSITATTALAADIAIGDIIEYGTMTGVARRRVADVTKLDVRITYPGKAPRTVVYPTVRITFGCVGGESLDYAPDSVVTVVR